MFYSFPYARIRFFIPQRLNMKSYDPRSYKRIRSFTHGMDIEAFSADIKTVTAAVVFA